MRVIDIDGPEGNAFMLMGTAKSWMKQMGESKEDISEFTSTMMSADYGNLIAVFQEKFKYIVRLETEQEDYMDIISDCLVDE